MYYILSRNAQIEPCTLRQALGGTYGRTNNNRNSFRHSVHFDIYVFIYLPMFDRFHYIDQNYINTSHMLADIYKRKSTGSLEIPILGTFRLGIATRSAQILTTFGVKLN